MYAIRSYYACAAQNFNGSLKGTLTLTRISRQLGSPRSDASQTMSRAAAAAWGPALSSRSRNQVVQLVTKKEVPSGGLPTSYNFV